MKKIIAYRFSFFFQSLGESVCAIIVSIAIRLFGVFGKALVFVWKKTTALRKTVFLFLQYAGVFFASPFVKIASSFDKMKNDIKTAKAEKGGFAGIRASAPHVRAFFFGKHGLAVTLFNLAAPVISVIFLFSVVTYTTGINYLVSLSVNGKNYGYIENERVFYDAEKIVEQRLNILGSTKQLEITPHFSVERVGYAEAMNSYQVADLLLSNSNINSEYAYGITINGTMRGAVKDNSGIKRTLESLLNIYRTGAADEEVKFLWEIDCERSGLYTTDSIIDPSIIISEIVKKKEEAQYYEVEYGDSHSLIGDKLDMTMAEIEAFNPGFTDMDLHTGDRIKFTAEVPYLPVSVTGTEVYSEEIAHETEYTDDPSMFEGTSEITQKGEDGVKTVTARVTSINGVETQHTVVKEVITSSPVTEIIRRGTKTLPRNTISTETASYGKFIWPVKHSQGKITQTPWKYGGYAGHAGVDFGAPYGTPVYAGANGTVIFSGYYYDYGYTVIIQHENGLKTYYAHNSSLEVDVGEVVAQGQCIALVGSTGTSYGNHVHFEVRRGNTILDPMELIDYNPAEVTNW